MLLCASSSLALRSLVSERCRLGIMYSTVLHCTVCMHFLLEELLVLYVPDGSVSVKNLLFLFCFVLFAADGVHLRVPSRRSSIVVRVSFLCVVPHMYILLVTFAKGVRKIVPVAVEGAHVNRLLPLLPPIVV